MGGEEMNRYALFFVGLGLASTLLEAEDLGQKINSYAVKDGKKVWEEDRFGNRTEFEYDRAGQLVNTRRSGMSVSGNVYKNGLLKEQRTIFGAVVKMNYDAQGRLVEKLTSGRKAEQKYDKYGRMVERKGAGEYPLKFAYTGWGELAGYTDGNGSTTKFEYDKSGKLIKRIWPDGTPVKYGYANGRLVSKEEAGRKTAYQYDDFGRMTEEKIVQGKESLTTKMTYDENGRMSSITDGKTTVKFAYDRFGRKLLEDGPVGTLTMMYDEKGRLSARQVQFKGKNEKFTTEYKYDEYDRVVTVKSPSGEFHYTWTKDNKIATQSIGDKKVVNTYDKAGRLISKTFGDTVLAKYEYDSLDRRIKGQYFDVKWDYSYDQYNQLIGAKNSNGDSYQYEYDSIGNRLKAVENGKPREFSYNNLNQISNAGYAYDAWGNMIKTPEAEYKYDLKNRLIEVKKKDGIVVKYEYDPMAQRISSIVSNNDAKTVFLMSDMVEFARNDGKKLYHTLGLDLLGTLEQTGAVGSILATNDMNYLYDGNGNVTASVKDSIIVDKLAYEPFGKQITGIVLPFTFSSKPVDQSGMSYYGYRFYNYHIARWEKIDPLAEKSGYNHYVSFKNNTFSNFDLLGLENVPFIPDKMAGTSPVFTPKVGCRKCSSTSACYCLIEASTLTNTTITWYPYDGPIYTDYNADKTLKRTCKKRYLLKENTYYYNFIKRHEQKHISIANEDFITSIKVIRDSPIYKEQFKIESDCITAATSLAKSATNKWLELYEINYAHSGSKWDGLRNTDMNEGVLDIVNWTVVTSCGSWTANN